MPHKRLLNKLSGHGIEGKIKNWIEDWLSNRYQRTCIGGVKSKWKEVTNGVPQGSVLGPVLFLMYINDLDSGVMSWVLKFADETKIFRKIMDDTDASMLQRDLDQLVEWSLD